MVIEMKGVVQIILGLAFLVLVLLALTYPSWLLATIKLIQGGIVLLLALAGVVLLLIGLSDLKSNS